jgi:hypothetical protein
MGQICTACTSQDSKVSSLHLESLNTLPLLSFTFSIAVVWLRDTKLLMVF